MSDYLGRIIEFSDSSTLKFGLVTGGGPNKVQLKDHNGRQHTISPKHILIVHPGQVDPSRFASHASELASRIAAIEAEIDSALLWESIEAHEHEYLLADLTDLYFGVSDADHQSAMLRSVQNDPVRFKIRGTHVTPRGLQQVEDQLRASRRREEKEQFRLQALEWLEQIVETGEAPTEDCTEEQNLLIRRIEDYLKNQQDDEIGQMLASVDRDSTPRMTAFEVLSALGRLPEEADPILAAAGIDPKFGQAAVTESGRLAPYRSNGNRQAETAPVVFSIDDETTREVDDALAVISDGPNLVVSIHISDVSYFVADDSVLNQEASKRKSSIYLPQATVRMLPERLSCDLASLSCGELRPSMRFRITLDSDAEVVDWRIERSEVRVTHRLTYDEADEKVHSSGQDEISVSLRQLDQLTERLCEHRIGNGALLLQKPELKITVEDDIVSVKVIPPNSVSRRIVSELMILANNLAASYAAEQRIPMIFRSQPPPSEPISVPEQYDPVTLNDIFSKLEKSKLSVYPQSHAGLGLDHYTQLTSPIRRYLDLVLQRQMLAHFSGDPLPYEMQQMMEILGTYQAAESDIRAAERQANRLFTLRFLEQNHNESVFEAVVVKDLPNGFLVETDDYYIRGLLSGVNGLKLRDRLKVKIERIHPEKNTLVFVSA